MQHPLFTFAVLLFSGVAYGSPSLQIVDDDGKPVERFEVMLHGTDRGYSRWTAGANGTFEIGTEYNKSPVIDVFVRADGYASAAQGFQGGAKQELLNVGTKITLERGREVRLRLCFPNGEQPPQDLRPQFYFPEFAWRVQMLWLPENLGLGQQDLNMLNVETVDKENAVFVLRLPKEPRKFCVAIHKPGWLQYFESEPLTVEDFSSNPMDLAVAPAKIDFRFEWGDEDTDAAKLPFDELQYTLMRHIPRRSGSMSIVASGKLPLTEPAIKFADLGPGTYRLQITTQPKGADKIKAASHDEINPGRFNDIKTIKLDTGQTVETNAHYVPFNPDAIRGNRTARVHIFGPDGSPAVGRTLKVSCFDGHYGSLKVFDGPIQPDGVVTLEGVTDFAPADIPFGPYRVEVDGEQIGWFRVRAEQAPQDFKFPLAPKKGDNAPDLELVDTQSNEHIRLKDLRGKVVFLEFWETGCGPCQPAMAKLNEVVGAHGDDWKNDVAVLSISFDDSPEIINSHVQSRGWTNLRHYWSAKNGAEYFTDAALRYVVQGVPTALLIDREGKIVWRGHPSSFDLTEEVKKLTSR